MDVTKVTDELISLFEAARGVVALTGAGAQVIDNAERTGISEYADFAVLGRAGEILPQFIKERR